MPFINVTCVRPVAQHQADSGPCFVVEEDRSGHYQQVNRSSLYCPLRGEYLSLSEDGMHKALAGYPVRVSSSAFS